MAWYNDRPAGTDEIRDIVIHMPQNWAYLQKALSAEHVFPGVYGATAGRHITGAVSVLFYGTTVEIAALTAPPEGAMVYDTELYRLQYYSSGWVGFDGLLHRKNGWMTGNLAVVGSLLDGRDPSADGDRLDKMDGYAVATGVVSDPLVDDGEQVVVPDMPASASFQASDCEFLAMQRSFSQVASTFVDSDGNVTTRSGGAFCICIGVK